MHARRMFILVMTILLLTVQIFTLFPQTPVNAFSLDAHQSILYTALPLGISNVTDVDQGAMNEIVGSFWTGAGNRGSDLYQSAEFRHFDGAPSPAAVCARANQVWSLFVSRIDSGSQILNSPSYDRLSDAISARSAFGGLTHALQDFYSHSNWIELGFRTQAPLFPICSAAALPPGLQTGYFRIGISHPVSGCPEGGPPAPFLYCHLHLNKDKPQDHGADIIPGSGGVTYHTMAMNLARAHTSAIYTMIRSRVEGSVSPSTHDVSGSCVGRLLFQWSWHGACADISGRWAVTVPDPSTRNPPLGQVWSLTQSNPLSLVGTIPSVACGTLSFSAARTSTTVPFNGSVASCPVPVTGPCPAQLLLPLSLLYAGQGWLGGQLTLIEVEETQTECRETRRQVQTFELRRSP